MIEDWEKTLPRPSASRQEELKRRQIYGLQAPGIKSNNKTEQLWILHIKRFRWQGILLLLFFYSYGKRCQTLNDENEEIWIMMFFSNVGMPGMRWLLLGTRPKSPTCVKEHEKGIIEHFKR